MRYKVPQDVQREDQILWFITLKQLVILLVGFGISYTIFVKMKAKYDLTTFDLALIWFPAAIAAAFAFLKIRGIGLCQFITLLAENTIFRRPRRWWVQHGGEPFLSCTTRIESLEKKKNVVEDKVFDESKARELAQFLDAQKSEFSKLNTKTS